MANEETQHGPTIVLFVIIGMVLGSVFRQVSRKTKIPYTPILLILGLILGYYRKSLGVLGQSTDILQKLNPHMILLIFIPVLIFESAYNCNWFVFRKSIINILILAVPGVLLGAILLGICFKIFLFHSDSDLTWSQSFTLGSILSATDPVAVASLLKQLGASVQFNTLIEGQSLLNDGTSMVFFMLFLDLVKGNTTSFGVLIWDFTRTSLGGPILGLLFGIICMRCLKRIFNDSVLTANITFVSCYLVFYIAEFTWIRVSGMLSVVTLGLYMSATSKTKLAYEQQHTLHTIWSFIQYVCETIIFLLTGAIIGVQIIQRSTITFADWVRLFLFWFFLIGARFLMLATFYPIMKKFGYGINKKELVVIVYGGLRGAISLSLALIVMVDSSLSDRFRQLTIFYTGGTAMLTILVNGLTAKRIINHVQMIVVQPIKDKLLKVCMKKVSELAIQKLQDMKMDRFLFLADWKKVQQLTGWEKSKKKSLTEKKKQISLEMSIRNSLFANVQKYQIDEQIRFRLLRFIKTSFLQSFQRGQCSEDTIVVLSNSVDILLDDISNKIDLWNTVSKNFNFHDIPYWIKLKDMHVIGKIAQKVIVNRIYFVNDVCTTMVSGCQQALCLFLKTSPMKKQYIQLVVQQLQQNTNLAEQYLSELEHTYQSLLINVHTQKAAANLLLYKKNQLNDMKQKGFVDQIQYQQVSSLIYQQTLAIKSDTNYRWERITFQEVILECPIFSGLTQEQMRMLRMSSQQKSYRQGQTIQVKNSNITLVYIIIQGIVQQIYNDYKTIRSIGSILSIHSVITGNISVCTIKAYTTCVLLGVQLNTFRKLVLSNKQIQSRVFKAAFVDSVKNDRNNPMSLHSDIELKKLSNRSSFLNLQPWQIVSLPYGGYIFNGDVVNISGGSSRTSIKSSVQIQQIYMFQRFVKPGVTIKAVRETLILVFQSKYFDENKEVNVITQKI